MRKISTERNHSVKILFRFIVLLAAVVVLFTGCTDSSEKKDMFVRVSIVESVFFTAENPSGTVERGGDYTVRLKMLKGYEPLSCDHASFSIDKRGDGEYELTLRNIERPARVTLFSKKTEKEHAENPATECEILFVYNDGTSECETVKYELSEHIRPNTRNGSGISRKGYTLIGWNTKADGSGEHVGLGSRYTVAQGQKAVLYGEWVKCQPESDFLYSVRADGTISLTGYKGTGDQEPFAIPSEIAGKTVSDIGYSFTTNIPCGEISAKTLILPDTVKTVSDYAFKNSRFEEIYFFDNLEAVGSKSFSQKIKTYHVNAAKAPCLLKSNYNARFADNIDILIVNKDKRKLLFFAGCSFAYGLDSAAVEEAFGGEYVVANLGINGEFDALFQLECILPYIGVGDILVHAPEQMSPYQFLASMRLDGRVFAMVEGNYDLLASVDFSYSDSVFEAYMMYNNLRAGQPPCKYSDDAGLFNKYGDYSLERPYDEATEVERDVAYSESYIYDTGLLTEENISRLASVYEKFEDLGARVCVSYAPMNRHSAESAQIFEKAANFEDELVRLLSPYGCFVISEISDYIFDGRYFYDSDYHLNDLGVLLRTERLIDDLFAAGIGGE